jgi:hypothetical protein
MILSLREDKKVPVREQSVTRLDREAITGNGDLGQSH